MDKKEMCKLSGKAKAKARKKAFVEAGKTHGNGSSIPTRFRKSDLKKRKRNTTNPHRNQPPTMIDGKVQGGSFAGSVFLKKY
jgi:hypothetical protein